MMIKKIFFLFILQISIQSFSQVLYSERFNSLSMNTGTYTSGGATQTYLYADVPSGMFMINNGNLIADTLTGNFPFRTAGQKQKAWLTYKHPSLADTFAVSTSWITPLGNNDAWMITPIINNISANSVLTWEAMAPDVTNADGYEVIISTNTTSLPTIGDFTTNNRVFSTGTESSNWTTHGVSLSAYAGQSIRIAFHNNSVNKYQLWVDDIVVNSLASNYDMAAFSYNTYKYSTINTNNSIMASFKNNGALPVTSLVLNYQIGSNPVVSETQNLINPLNYLDATSFTFSTLYNSPSPEYNPVKLWISSINGQTDQLHTNDTVSGVLTISSTMPEKKVLVEEFMSARCASCPDDYTRLSTIVSTHTNMIATSIHSSDSLTNATGAALTAVFADPISSGMIDRYIYPGVSKRAIGHNDWETYIDQRVSMPVPADVSITDITYNATTRVISAKVSANFVGDVKGDYRINLYVKENNIYGPIMDISDNGWNQYSGLYNIQASPYYQVGYYLNAGTHILGPNQYSHQYVISEFLDGTYGAAGIIPSNSSTIGQSYSKTYTYTLPMALSGQYRYNPDNIYLVGTVSEYTGNYNGIAILNAKEVKLTSNSEAPVGVQQLAAENVSLLVYPNPASDVCYLNYKASTNEEIKLEVYNTLGEMIYTQTGYVNPGDNVQQIDCSAFAEGNYHLVLKFKDYSVSKKLTVIK